MGMPIKLRKELELRSALTDAATSREAWRSIGKMLAESRATHPVESYDAKGNETSDYITERKAYAQLIDALGGSREPTQLEMIMATQMIKARTDVASAVFIRDTMGAKPVDETKSEVNVTSEYEQLSDEEIELLMAHRASKESSKVAIEIEAKESGEDVT